MNGIVNIKRLDNTDQPLLFFFGTQGTGSTNPPGSYLRHACNSEYFSYSSGYFTVLKDFSGTAYIWGQSSRNSSGNSNTLKVHFWINSVDQFNCSGNNFSSTNQAISLVAGDKIHISGGHSLGGTVRTGMGLIITL